MAGSFGLLTHKQLRVIALREGRGLSFSQIARILGSTRQDAASTYHRALANIEAARETLIAYTLATSCTLVARRGSSIEELVEELLRIADSRGIRLRWGKPELYMLLRGLLRDHVEAGILRRDTIIAIRRDGAIEAYDLASVERVLRALEDTTPC